MVVVFNQFEFDCNLLILTKNGQEISLNEKSSRLLMLLVTNTDHIHSKADILESIWPNRVVSDQVIFQNISHLRALFGDKAIKTYSKKGYQWKLDLTVSHKKESSISTINSEEPSSTISKSILTPPESVKKTNQNHHSFINKFTFLFSLFIFIAVLIYSLMYKAKSTDTHISDTVIHVLPFTTNSLNKNDSGTEVALTNNIINRLNQTNHTDRVSSLKNSKLSNSPFNNQTLFDSPYRTWQNIAQSDESLIFGGRLYLLNDLSLLRFQIQGKNRGWYGYLSGKNQIDVSNKLVSLLNKISVSGFLSSKSDNTALAKLILLQDQEPDNLTITKKLIQLQYKLRHYDVANALTDTLLNSSHNHIEMGLIHLLKAQISKRDDTKETTHKSLNMALDIFEQVSLTHLQAKTKLRLAWLLYFNDNYDDAVMQLNNAAQLARSANEPLLEVQAYLTQTALAAKTQRSNAMYIQSDLSKQLIKLHKLDATHQVPILSSLAATESQLIESIKHYNDILKFPYSPRYSNHFYYAAEQVINFNINNQQWQLAQAAISSWQRASFSLIMRAKIHFSKQEYTLGWQSALKAFNQARIDFRRIDALDAALLLLENYNEKSQTDDPTELIQYISNNKESWWIKEYKDKLEYLGHWKNEL